MDRTDCKQCFSWPSLCHKLPRVCKSEGFAEASSCAGLGLGLLISLYAREFVFLCASAHARAFAFTRAHARAHALTRAHARSRARALERTLTRACRALTRAHARSRALTRAPTRCLTLGDARAQPIPKAKSAQSTMQLPKVTPKVAPAVTKSSPVNNPKSDPSSDQKLPQK